MLIFNELIELNQLVGNSTRLARTRLVKNVEARLGSFNFEFESSRVASYSFSSRVSSLIPALCEGRVVNFM